MTQAELNSLHAKVNSVVLQYGQGLVTIMELCDEISIMWLAQTDMEVTGLICPQTGLRYLSSTDQNPTDQTH